MVETAAHIRSAKKFDSSPIAGVQVQRYGSEPGSASCAVHATDIGGEQNAHFADAVEPLDLTPQ